MKGTVYTCITGKYDILRRPTIITKGWEYICFTDNKSLLNRKEYEGYKIRSLIIDKYDPVRNARYQKILAPGIKSNFFIWHDANMRICCNLDIFIKCVKTTAMMRNIAFLHIVFLREIDALE